jgi:hypothetical protein
MNRDQIENKGESKRALKTRQRFRMILAPSRGESLARRWLGDDMETRRIVACVTGVIVAVGALLGAGTVAQANEQPKVHGSKARAIEGVWLPIVTITDCQSQAEIITFPSMDIYVRGGGFIGFGAVRQSDQVGMGAWRHVGGRTYTAQYQFFNYIPFGAPDGTPDGTLLRVTATITLNAAGTAFEGSQTGEVVDFAGNVLGQVCGTRTATRLQ